MGEGPERLARMPVSSFWSDRRVAVTRATGSSSPAPPMSWDRPKLSLTSTQRAPCSGERVPRSSPSFSRLDSAPVVRVWASPL